MSDMQSAGKDAAASACRADSMECRADYQKYRLGDAVEHIKAMAILLGIFNLLLLIPDRLMLADGGGFYQVLIARILFSLALFALYFGHRKIGTFQTLSRLVSLCELLAVAVFVFAFMKYEEPDLLIQTLGMLIIILVVFLVPNRWAYMLVVSAVGACGFLLFAYTIADVSAKTEFWAAVVYTTVALGLCAHAAYLTEAVQFREFAARRELERISSTDYLTKTANRYKMDEEAGKWIDFCKRNNLPLTLVFIDIDNFKTVNDLYGHVVGDTVLSSLSELIRGQMRTSDVISRWGGDEFILLLPNTNLKSAVSIVERIKSSVGGNTFFMDVKVTCSFGIVGMKEDSDLKSLVEEADGLMYDGKKREKNGLQYPRFER